MEKLDLAKQNSVSDSIREPNLKVGDGEFHVPSGPDPLERFGVVLASGMKNEATEEFVLVELL